MANGTWTLVRRPPGVNLIRNKWVYKIKQKQDGSIDRYKAQLVAKGFDQRDGIDYSETFSPMIKPATVRAILALAIHYDWCIRQLDVSNTFLHGNLQEDVYMEQSRGFIDSDHLEYVCKLRKSLYGLKQAPRAWYDRLSQALLALGFQHSQVDFSLFLFDRDGVQLYFLLYVDDIVLTGTSRTAIFGLIRQLLKSFAMKDLGDLNYFLGIQVQRSSQGIHLRQSKYILDILQ